MNGQGTISLPVEAWELADRVQKLTLVELLQAYAIASGRWCVLISFEDLEEAGWDLADGCAAAPYLAPDSDRQLLADGYGVISCESREEMEAVFALTVGDSGPTERNPYQGLVRAYALACSPSGILLAENA